MTSVRYGDMMAKAGDAVDQPVLAAHDVSVVYGRPPGHNVALSNATLEVRPGEAVGIIGESGSGKTTLTRVLTGLRKPTSGIAHFRGLDIYSMKAQTRYRTLSQDIALVFQDPRSSLNPRHSVGAVLRDPLEVHRVGSRESRNKTVAAVLESVGLPGRVAERQVKTLSGGQLQRVALARALVLEPSVVIADEVTSALDVSVAAQILNLIRDIREERHLALVVVSHDVQVIRYLTEQTIVMLQGKIVETGPTAELFEQPKAEYTQALLTAAPTLAGRVPQKTQGPARGPMNH